MKSEIIEQNGERLISGSPGDLQEKPPSPENDEQVALGSAELPKIGMKQAVTMREKLSLQASY